MEMELELVPIPVADVDRAKAFYTEQLGFVADVDVAPAPGVRVVQLTPPGSACSIGIGTGLGAYDGRQPGAVQALHLVVPDIEAARAGLVGPVVPARIRLVDRAPCQEPAPSTSPSSPSRCPR